MSDQFVYIVPTDPYFVPDEETVKKAMEFLVTDAYEDSSISGYCERYFWKGELITISGLPDDGFNRTIDIEMSEFISISATPEFYDGCQNFDKIFCPNCRNEIDCDSWLIMIDQAQKDHFTDLSCTPSCCQIKTTLNDLDYGNFGAFARFGIQLHGNIPLTNSSKQKLEQLLGCQIKEIFVWV